MAIKFPVNARCYYDNANWLDNISAFSWAGWVRFDTIDTNSLQFVWAHVGATDRMEVYKLRTNGRVRCQVYAGGIGQFVEDSTGSPVAGTTYHLAATWTKAATGGLKIYRNGVFVAQSNTTTQTGNYNSGGSVDLVFGARNTINYGLCSLEGHGFWPGAVLTAEQIRCLYWSGWPHLVAPKPAAFYTFAPETLTTFKDSSGNSRHITSTWISGAVATAGTIGKWDAPDAFPGDAYRVSAAGPVTPNDWTLFGSVTHPTVTSTVTGLTNGTTYELAVTALDESGNESQLSAIVEATPSAVAVKHVPRRVFRGH